MGKNAARDATLMAMGESVWLGEPQIMVNCTALEPMRDTCPGPLRW